MYPQNMDVKVNSEKKLRSAGACTHTSERYLIIKVAALGL